MICDEENCELNVQDPNGDTALHFAGRAAQKELFECILSQGIVHSSPLLSLILPDLSLSL